jgi:hypothetical protein
VPDEELPRRARKALRMTSPPAPATASRRAGLRAAARPGILAGLLAALLIDAYRLGVDAFAHGTEVVEHHYRHVAAAVIGAGAFALPGAAYLGVAIHVVVSVAWAVGFASVALQAPQVVRRPILSGAVFGVVVYITMQLIEYFAGTAHPVTPAGIFAQLVAHTIFFGIPLALVVDARLRAR